MRKEIDLDTIIDLNRIFGYEFIINDGEIKAMISKEESKQQFIMMIV